MNKSWRWIDLNPSPAFLSRAILVLGVPRSGTSAVAGVLHRLGVRMCENIPIVGPPNPTGTWEDAEFMALALLFQRFGFEASGDATRSLARLIRKRNANYCLWGVKELRLAFYLSKVAPLFEDLRVVVVSRDMEAIAASFAKWEGVLASPPFSDFCTALSTCVLALTCPRLTIAYERLLTNTESEVRRLANFAFDGLLFGPGGEEIAETVKFVDPSLQHFGT